MSGHGFIGDMLARDGRELVPDLDALAVRVQDAWLLVHEARYRELGELLPRLMRDCELAAWKCAESDRPRAFRLLAELYQAVAAMMAKLGEPDAAWVAADRSAFAASRAGDGLLAAAGDFRLGHAFLSDGQVEQAERAVRVAAEGLDTRTEQADVLVLVGALNLVLAIAAARRGDRAGAEAALTVAEDAARRLGRRRDERFDTEFGAENVAIHAVSVAAELGDAGLALRRSAEVDASSLSSERRARLLIDVARAHAQRRDGAAAVGALEQAEALAPELVRHHWLARETVRGLLRRERGRAKVDRPALAVRMGLL
jgi:hypothetical protein